ncbi:hypothetical protein CSOJ01_04916 [Colletotrichum sojae]|uniref:Uncharacterized protein n=1 Tax=Colletotrichum sojae TaxID=2175907 RepID=A0A8H6JHV0_9PEZI|nr:hypothetical protein CSOJ01_04916 [Colletotrichum sojae]
MRPSRVIVDTMPGYLSPSSVIAESHACCVARVRSTNYGNMRTILLGGSLRSVSVLARTDLETDANLGSDPSSLPPCSILPNHVGRSKKRFLAIVSSSAWLEALDGQAAEQSGSSDGLGANTATTHSEYLGVRRGRLWWLFWLAPVASPWAGRLLSFSIVLPSIILASMWQPTTVSFSLAADATGHILRRLEIRDSRTRDDATPERCGGLPMKAAVLVGFGEGS